jgi:hypothetical protein
VGPAVQPVEDLHRAVPSARRRHRACAVHDGEPIQRAADRRVPGIQGA